MFSLGRWGAKAGRKREEGDISMERGGGVNGEEEETRKERQVEHGRHRIR
jgi:hypothetical protein